VLQRACLGATVDEGDGDAGLGEPVETTGESADAGGEQPRVGRILDLGFDDGRVHTHLRQVDVAVGVCSAQQNSVEFFDEYGLQRVVILRIVDSSGTFASRPMRQNRRKLIESDTIVQSRS
jgi:hypothetical protein